MTWSIREWLRAYRTLVVLGSAAMLAELGYAILNLSALPMYVKFSLDRGPAWGLILATFLMAEAVSRPAFGALGDRIGRKPLMVAGPAITAVTSYLTIAYSGPYVVYWLVALRAIDGLGSGALWPSAFAAIGDVVEEKNRSTAMSVLNVTYMGGLALGFLMGGRANEMFHTYTASFYLVSILLLLAVIVMLVFLPRKMEAHAAPKPAVHPEVLEIPTFDEPAPFRLGTLLRSFREVPEMILLACLVFLGIGMLMPIVKLYAVEHLGMTETQFGIMVAPVAAAMGLSAVPLGRLGDRYGKCLAVCWGLLGSAVAMWVLALFRSVVLAVTAAAALGVGFTVAFPAWMALVSSATGANRRGEVLGAIGMAQGLAAIAGTMLGAYVYSSDLLSFPRLGVVNYNVPFWFAAVLLTAGTVMAFTWVSERHGCRDPRGGINRRTRSAVVLAAVLGIVALGGWIGYRYALPVAPDRVAWSWVQQLARNRPDKALRYMTSQAGSAADSAAISRQTARRYSSWTRDQQARYTVFFARHTASDAAVVPVRFNFPGKKHRFEYVRLCRQESGEWRVCGVSAEE